MPPGELAIRVDGVTKAFWKVSECNLVQLEIDPGAELIEVVAEDEIGGFPLVSWLVTFDPESGHQRAADASVMLPGGGQFISLRVRPGRESSGAEQAAKLELRYSAAGSTTGAAAVR